jgi:hypothetical protein|tara:strand:- start:139 stop:399 length:261 start_codon:yes stop_codon:yes gene_type:complete
MSPGTSKSERRQLIGRFAVAQTEMGIAWTLEIKKKVCKEPLDEAPIWKVRRLLESMEEHYRRQFVAQKKKEREGDKVTQGRLFKDG